MINYFYERKKLYLYFFYVILNNDILYHYTYILYYTLYQISLHYFYQKG